MGGKDKHRWEWEGTIWVESSLWDVVCQRWGHLGEEEREESER